MNIHRFGFRSGNSTVSAAMLVLDAVLNLPKHCAASFIVLSKAFNTVEYSLPILSEMGLHKESCKWSTSYLTDSAQRVLSDGVKSSFLNIRKGVP